jgi:lysophospholipase L1-like esterase
MKIVKHILAFACCFLSACITIQAQWTTTLPSGMKVEDNLDNHILYFGNAEQTYSRLFQSLNNLVQKGEGTVHIVQIGDSHIQAGFFPEEMRKDFSTFISGGCGARGFIFPYRIAKTNNPTDYSVKFTGIWENARNVELKKHLSMGFLGIMAQTKDTSAEMTFHFREYSSFRDFNFIRIFHNTGETNSQIVFPGLEGHYTIAPPVRNGITEVTFDRYMKDSLKLKIIHKDSVHKYFSFYGIDFENGDPGIVYSAAGVNGAEVTSYLRCELFKDQLSDLKPAWVIISLGTNDAYPMLFNKEEFIVHYESLVKEIRMANPGVPVLLTVPGDSYRRHRYDNLNLPSAREAIIEVAKQTDCAVWDFYSLMGGSKSIMNWYKAGLVAKDKLHFDKQGYVIQADLLFSAFIDAYTSFIDKSNSSEE